MQRLLNLTGPTGAGKTAIAEYLEKEYGFAKIISCTTRPRRNDQDKYEFMSEEEFDRRAKAQEFLETNRYASATGSYAYGIMKSSISDLLSAGKKPLIVNDRNGARNVKRFYPDAVTILIEPPSREIAIARVIGPGRNMPLEQALRRLEEDPVVGFKNEDFFDAFVVNETNKMDAAVQKILDCYNALVEA